MEQRRLRLGDVLDDYCPHERRLSNHVIVAMVGDDIIKTRCTTCDTEHPYKHARVPARRRKKEEPKALYKEVLEGLTEQPPALPAPAESSQEPVTELADSVSAVDSAERASDAVAAAALSPESDETSAAEESLDAVPREEAADEGPHPHHRVTLIRATLPRPEGQTGTRQPPEFTMHRMRNGPTKQGGRRVRGGGKGSGWSGDPKPGGKGGFNARPSRPRGSSRPDRDGRRSPGPRRSR
ncbi:MAG: hypothetical protein GEV06_02225 [Luteitalea sp.]|nr:hypothetical protein [Luteitalea sp.]